MSKVVISGLLAGIVVCLASSTLFVNHARAQGPEAPAVTTPEAGKAAEAKPGELVAEPGKKTSVARAFTFWNVVFGSGWLGAVIWIALFAAAGLSVYFVVDSVITVREKRIMPPSLVEKVTAAMSEGDVLKALQSCEEEAGPLANILSAGFGQVEEGFEVIQEAVSKAAELETERITQKLNWMAVIPNLATMLGLLGTVQGMIMAFASIGTGTPDIGFLAVAIAQALYTTFAGLSIAIPTVGVYQSLKNSATRIILRMEALTMQLIKDLRNVEVVEE
ncbi:MAG: MotA/TolQ/ExbB proton channel family protein [Kiritimatiellia bacterium]